MRRAEKPSDAATSKEKRGGGKTFSRVGFMDELGHGGRRKEKQNQQMKSFGLANMVLALLTEAIPRRSCASINIPGYVRFGTCIIMCIITDLISRIHVSSHLDGSKQVYLPWSACTDRGLIGRITSVRKISAVVH